MFSKKQNVLLLFVLILLVSCVKPGQYNTRERYIVTSNNLNIRSDPSTLSRIIGSLSKGDTVAAIAADRYWIMIRYKNQSGFISNYYLKKVTPPNPPLFFRVIENNSNWKSWKFWVAAVILISMWIGIVFGISRFERHIKRNLGVSVKNLSITPILAFVAGILTAVLYLFWKDQVIEALFLKFSLLPIGTGGIAWAIWIQIVAVIMGLTFDFVNSLYTSGFVYGTQLFLTEIFENTIIFVATIFLTVSVFLVAIISLTIIFALQYITTVSENSSSFAEILFKRQ